MIGKKCLKSLLVLGGIMSVFAFGKTALADEVPVIKGDDGKYDISCIVQAPEGSRWLTNYFLKMPFTPCSSLIAGFSILGTNTLVVWYYAIREKGG